MRHTIIISDYKYFEFSFFKLKSNVKVNYSDGKLIIAVVLPFKPYVERGGINNRPVIDVQSYQSVSRHHCDQLDTFVMAVQNR